jgi:hypothetical protein
MTIRSKQYLKSKFLTGAKPTQKDYHDLIESVVNQEEAAAFGLGEYNPTALYKAGAGTLRLGKIYQALEDVSGTFNPLKWRDITSQVLSTGFPIWNSGESVPVNAYRERNSRLFKSLQNGNTGNDPVLDSVVSPVWWQEISASSGAFGKYWQNGLYFHNDVVRFFDASLGRVRLLEMTQASLISSDVSTEFQEGKWRDVGGVGSSDPGVGSGTAETADYTRADSDNTNGFWKTLLTAGKLKVSSALDRVALTIGLLGSLTTTNKTSIVAAINEVNAKPSGGGSITDGDKGEITVSGTGANWVIKALAIVTAKIADLAITTTKLAANSVTDEKLSSDASIDANRAVGTNHIKDFSTTTAKLANNAATNPKLAQMANLTAKGNMSGATSTPENVPLLNTWDGVQAQTWDNERGASRWGRGTKFKQTTTKTVANTTTKTSLIDLANAVGTNVFPAGAFRVGDSWPVVARGVVGFANSIDTLNIRVEMGAVVIATTGPIAAASFSSKAYKLEVEFTVLAITASGLIVCGGSLLVNGIIYPMTIDISAEWSAASASNTITQQQAKFGIH